MQTALYSGLRKMEWLLISCHNYWTVCLLVRDDNHWSLFELCLVPFYPMSKMSLSGVARTVPDMELDIIEDDGSFPENENTESELIVCSVFWR